MHPVMPIVVARSIRAISERECSNTTECPMTMLKVAIGASAQSSARHRLGRHGDLLALAAIAAAPGVLLAWLLPLPFVLPVLSVIAFVIACVVALFAYARNVPRRAPGMTLWDVAGIFTAIWITAGLLSGPARLIRFFEHLAAAI